MKRRKYSCLVVTILYLLGIFLYGNLTASAKVLLPLDTDEKIILEIPIGSENGQVGYSEPNWKSGLIDYKPNDFAVDDGGIYILDIANHRILIWKNGIYSCVDINKSLQNRFGTELNILVQDGIIGVIDRYAGDTWVYAEDGELLSECSVPYKSDRGYSLIQVDRSKVVWRYDSYYCEYNWTTGKSRRESYLSEFQVEGQIVYHEKTGQEWQTARYNPTVNGAYEGTLYYTYYDSVEGYVVHCTDLLGREQSVHIEFDDVYTYAGNSFFFSEKGKFYVMKCYEDCVTVSEILFENYPDIVTVRGYIDSYRRIWRKAVHLQN